MASSQYVTQVYQELLGRAPDAGGLKHYMGYSDPNAVRSSILGSAEYKQRQAGGGGGGGGNPSQALFDFAAQQRKEYETLLNRQKQEQQGLFGQYTQQLQGQEQLPAMYKRLQEEAGIPEATQQLQAYKDQIYRVKDLLDRLDEDVTSRTRGTLTTEAQRRAMIAQEGGDLNTQLGRLGTGMAPVVDLLTGAQSQVGTLLPLYTAQQEKELQPVTMQINALGDRFAREITGFTSNRENQLTAIMDKLERERQLSDREWELAQQLAAEERDFQRQKELAKISAQSQASNLSKYLGMTQSANTAQNQQTIRSLPNLPVTIPKAPGNTFGQFLGLQGGNPNLQATNNLLKALQGF